MTCHFYIKVDALMIDKIFNFNPLKEFLHFEKIMPLFQSKENEKAKIEKKLEKSLEICTKFINNDYIYVPYCLALISRQPYALPLEKCLDSFMKQIVLDEGKDISNFMKNLIYEIPVPLEGKKINFYVPYHLSHIEISNYITTDLPLVNYNLKIIFTYLSFENILIIFQLLLFEQKVLFISNNLYLLTVIQECFKSLLYPLKWVNTYIPVLSEELLKFLQSFMPFIMGINENNYPLCLEYLDSEEIFIVNINRDTIVVSKSNKKINRKELK